MKYAPSIKLDTETVDVFSFENEYTLGPFNKTQLYPVMFPVEFATAEIEVLFCGKTSETSAPAFTVKVPVSAFKTLLEIASKKVNKISLLD